MIRIPTLCKALLPLAGALALGACGEAEEPTYEADATDVSGGEFVVTDADASGVPVDVPDVAMTPVAPDGAAGATPEVTPTPE